MHWKSPDVCASGLWCCDYFLVCVDDPVRVLVCGSLFGSLTISSSSSQPSASHIRSRCSRFTLSAISWYRSLMVDGLMPVARARSACFQRFRPRSSASLMRIMGLKQNIRSKFQSKLSRNKSRLHKPRCWG